MSDDLVKWHKEQASRAMNSLSCGSENWEYREAHKQADFHREAAATIRTLQEQVKKARNDALEEAAALCDEQEKACWRNVDVYSPPMVGANEALRLLHRGGEQTAAKLSAAIRSIKANGESE